MKDTRSSVMRIPTAMVMGFGLANLLVAQNPPSPLPSPQSAQVVVKPTTRNPSKAIQWAQVEGTLLGENLSRFDAFMAARKVDIKAGAKAPWSDWLSELSASPNKTMKVWALTRLVEAGNYSKFPELTEAMVRHVRGETQKGSGLAGSVLDKSLPNTFGPTAPTFLVHEASPFWASLDLTIRNDPDRVVGGGLYTFWCYNTRPSQRDLIEEIARHIQGPLRSPKKSHPNPWEDPRFWIVLDWAIAWGEQQDLDRLGQLIPEGPARSEFLKRTQQLLANPVFSSCKPLKPLDDRKWDADSQLSPAAALGLDLPGIVDFSTVKVKYQPILRYPLEAKLRGVIGTNVILIKVDTAGIPCQARPAPGPWLAFLALASLDSVKDWRFEPSKLNGVPVESRFLLNIVYRLR